MKVLLVYPNANDELIGWGDLGAIAEPLALEYVAAGARVLGHEVRILDLRLHPRDLDFTLLAYRPDVVGVTGYSMHVLRNLAICKRVKELSPRCVVVVGGHHATLLPEDFFEPQVDVVVVGEGIRPFRALLEALVARRPLDAIKGTWTRRDGTFTFGGDQPPLDIDGLLVPDRDLVPDDRSRYFIDWMMPIALIRTTVGCPYRCSFCSLWRIMDGRYHRRNIDAVVEELGGLAERNVFLVDDEPFVNARRMYALAGAIEAAGIDKSYFAYCRIDSFLRERGLMETWRKIGLRRVFFGIETIFEHELADYEKRLCRDQIIEGLRAARELDIAVFSNFIIRPDYGLDEFSQVSEFVTKHGIEYPSFTILTPIPGTGMCENFEGIIARQPNGRPRWDLFDLQHAVTPTRLPVERFMQEYRRLQVVFAPEVALKQHPHHRLRSGVERSPVSQSPARRSAPGGQDL
ncbi:radical SAM protein [Sorangium sp. So ce429]